MALFDMETRDIFENLSPLDHRYWNANRDIFEALSSCLSEKAQVRYCARVEAALLATHLELRGRSRPELLASIERAAELIDPAAVYAEEETTRHNIRALVNVLQRALPAELAPLVHLGATSADILDTAKALALGDAARTVVVPLLARVVLELCRLAVDEADTTQVGRTHGQHAVPLTFGFAMAEYASRLGKSVLRASSLARELRGKLSGAVGSYNALSMSYREPEEVEASFLARLGLESSEHSTQIVEPEPVLRLLLELNVAFGVIANLADDLRNLQRTEIGEVRESFGSGQVGSSTMPQKRNPWNSEHVKSLWKAFSPRVATFFADQISEHQRDLSNSASERFVPEYLAGLAAASNRMLGVLKGLVVDRERMKANLLMTGGSILAEPAYILLAESGRPDAHEILRRITLAAEKGGLGFGAALAADKEAFEAIGRSLSAIGVDDARAFFAEPGSYRGRAPEKARRIGEKYRALMTGLLEGRAAPAGGLAKA
ncbi:MAG TPA: lyase family protein [Rectinemataceae bacterium]|nr:lyase family protein [Rectinemataceae bacterium]